MKLPFSNPTDLAKIERDIPLNTAWPDKTIYQQLCRTAKQFPDRPAIGFQLKSGPKDKSSTLTWRELTAQVTQAANAFRALGIGPNDVVACLIPNTPQTMIAMLGAMTAGIVAPINPTLQPEQIAALLVETNAKVLVGLKAFPKTNLAELAARATAESPMVETIMEIDLMPHLGGVAQFIAPMLRPKTRVKHHAQVIDFTQTIAKYNAEKLDFTEDESDPFCAYFHTGGTTGMPKIAQHRHSGALYNGWVCATLLYRETDVVLCPLPLFHVFAAYPVWMGCMATGAMMVLPTPAGYRGEGVFDNFWGLIERWNVTLMFTVPTAVAALLQRPVGDADISSLEGAVCGSAPLPVELFKRFQKVTGVEIMEGYGMTEATCLVSCNPKDGIRKIGSVGIPFPHTDVQIMAFDGEVGRVLAVGEIGEICVANSGVNINATYTAPARNVGIYAGNHVRTGDLGRMDAEGYLWITGRAKDVIIRGGHNIDPAVIEEALAASKDVAFAGAIGQPDLRAGEVPCAYVELAEGASVSMADLFALCESRIGEAAARPKYIEVLAELPKTAVGKVFKPALRKSAIKRVYDAALAEAGFGVVVVDVVEDKKLGLVAVIGDESGGDMPSDADITAVLGGFIYPWRGVSD